MRAIRENKPILLALALFVGAVIFIVGGRHISFVVPDSFSGLVTIIDTAKNDSSLRVSLWGTEIRVPASGVVEIDSIGRLQKWSYYSARNELGVVIPTHVVGTENHGDRALWILNSPQSRKLYYFVGSFQQMRSYMLDNERKLYGFDPGPLQLK